MDKRVYSKSWNETSFLSKLSLLFLSFKYKNDKNKSKDKTDKAEGYSSLSSTCYAIAGTSLSKLKESLSCISRFWIAIPKLIFWAIFWAPLGIFCYLRMLPYSNKMVSLVGLNGCSADQLDVRQCMLRKRKMIFEATQCIYAALDKNDALPHTKAFLHLGFILANYKIKEVRYLSDYGSAGLVHINKALSYLPLIEDEFQLIRVLRQLYFVTKDEQYLSKAKDLAHKNNAGDQLLKMC